MGSEEVVEVGPSFHTKESRRMGLSCRSHSIESSHLFELRSARSHPRGKNESSASRYPLHVPGLGTYQPTIPFWNGKKKGWSTITDVEFTKKIICERIVRLWVPGVDGMENE